MKTRIIKHNKTVGVWDISYHDYHEEGACGWYRFLGIYHDEPIPDISKIIEHIKVKHKDDLSGWIVSENTRDGIIVIESKNIESDEGYYTLKFER